MRFSSYTQWMISIAQKVLQDLLCKRTLQRQKVQHRLDVKRIVEKQQNSKIEVLFLEKACDRFLH